MRAPIDLKNFKNVGNQVLPRQSIYEKLCGSINKRKTVNVMPTYQHHGTSHGVQVNSAASNISKIPCGQQELAAPTTPPTPLGEAPLAPLPPR